MSILAILAKVQRAYSQACEASGFGALIWGPSGILDHPKWQFTLGVQFQVCDQIDLSTLNYFKLFALPISGIMYGSSPIHTNSLPIARDDNEDKSDSDFRGRQKLNFSQRLRGTNYLIFILSQFNVLRLRRNCTVGMLHALAAGISIDHS